MSYAIVVARFYEHLADRLVGGAQTAFAEAGAGEADVFEVPGAFELPLAALIGKAGGSANVYAMSSGCLLALHADIDRFARIQPLPLLHQLRRDVVHHRHVVPHRLLAEVR